jgi:nucleotide-binding universal stress UspA family protein
MLALIATDGSDASIAAARWCDEHLPRGTRFTVASVAPLPDEPMAFAGGIEGPLPDTGRTQEVAAQALDIADASVRETAEILAPLRVEERVVRGEAGEALCSLADELDVDVVIVGSHQRGALTRVFLGSVSDYVVHHSKRPVVVVPLVEDAEPDAADS